MYTGIVLPILCHGVAARRKKYIDCYFSGLEWFDWMIGKKWDEVKLGVYYDKIA